MSAFIITLHIIACLILIVLVLLQSGKEGMGVIFGGGSGSVFGSSGAGGLLVKLTSYVAAVFLVTSLAYNYYSSAERRGSTSVMQNVNIEDVKPKAPAGGNAAPAPGAPAATPDSKEAPKSAVQFEDVKPQPLKPGLTAPAPNDAAVPALPGVAAKQEPAAAPEASAPAQAPAKPAEAPQK